MLGVGFAGVVLAFAQYGRGYRRAMLVLLGCATLGFLGGKARMAPRARLKRSTEAHAANAAAHGGQHRGYHP